MKRLLNVAGCLILVAALSLGASALALAGAPGGDEARIMEALARGVAQARAGGEAAKVSDQDLGRAAQDLKALYAGMGLVFDPLRTPAVPASVDGLDESLDLDLAVEFLRQVAHRIVFEAAPLAGDKARGRIMALAADLADGQADGKTAFAPAVLEAMGVDQGFLKGLTPYRYAAVSSTLGLYARALAVDVAGRMEPRPGPDELERVITSEAVFPLVAFDPAKAGKMRKAMEATIAAMKIPGAVLAVRDLKTGASWIGAAGVAELGTGRPMTRDTRSKIGSHSKTLTATAVFRLLEQGKFRLDDTLASVLPGMVAGDDKITIRMLLNHTSGLFNYTNSAEYLDETTHRPLERVDPKVWVQVSERYDRSSKPGAEWHYTNTGYTLLGLIIEKYTGMPLEKAIDAMVVRPLGLRYTEHPVSPHLTGLYAKGYYDLDRDGVLEPQEVMTDLSPSYSWAAGSIVTAGPDFLTWVEEYVGKEMFTPRMNKDRYDFFKTSIVTPAGWRLLSGLAILNEDKDFGHRGEVEGYQATGMRSKRYAYAVMCNAWSLAEVGNDGTRYQCHTTLYSQARAILEP